MTVKFECILDLRLNGRDQRITDGSPSEVAFWNSLISLMVEERHRRKEEVRRLESMFQTGRDPGS